MMQFTHQAHYTISTLKHAQHDANLCDIFDKSAIVHALLKLPQLASANDALMADYVDVDLTVVTTPPPTDLHIKTTKSISSTNNDDSMTVESFRNTLGNRMPVDQGAHQ
jgi:hypothetical protein